MFRIACFSLSVLFLLFLPCIVSAQSNKSDDANAQLYGLALNACVNKELKDFAKVRSGLQLFNRVVERYDELTNELPTVFGNVKVEYLGLADLETRYSRNKEKINVLRLRPAVTKGTSLVIRLGEYWFSYRKKSYMTEWEGGCIVTFEPDLAKGNFQITRVELWGV